MEENNVSNNVKKCNKKGLLFLIVVLVILLIAMSFYIVHNTNNSNNTKITEKEALKIAEDAYKKAFNDIEEGLGLKINSDGNGVEKTDSSNNKIYCYEINQSKLKKIFTEKAINSILVKIESYVSEIESNKKFTCSSDQYIGDKTEYFLNTVFGITDSGLKNLKIINYSDNLIIAMGSLPPCGELCPADTNEYYIAFKNINNIWLIDMFE